MVVDDTRDPYHQISQTLSLFVHRPPPPGAPGRSREAYTVINIYIRAARCVSICGTFDLRIHSAKSKKIVKRHATCGAGGCAEEVSRLSHVGVSAVRSQSEVGLTVTVTVKDRTPTRGSRTLEGCAKPKAQAALQLPCHCPLRPEMAAGGPPEVSARSTLRCCECTQKRKCTQVVHPNKIKCTQKQKLNPGCKMHPRRSQIDLR